MKQSELNVFEKSTDLLSNLNKQQKEAVIHKSGPLLIIAGAGTGKTLVITRRIAHIISQKWAEPHQILALTFTDKAAGEMEERVDQAVPYGFVDTNISTFHAFGDRLLRDYAIDLGLPANFKVLSATEQAIFMRQNLYAFDLNYYRPISNPVSHINELLSHFSRLKDELISPEEYLSWAENNNSKLNNENQNQEDKIEIEKYLELAHAYQRYQELMLQSGNLDYGDQIYLTYQLLKNNPQVLKECQEKYKYILVDEFQDTNYAQYQIVRLLAAHGNITVVGDDDQSIYRFRGASISNILSFRLDYPKCHQVVLNQNYRSTQEILDASYKLIQHNNPDRLEIANKIDKKLVSSKHGHTPELLHCDTLSCEADQVVQKIIQLKEERGLEFNDFAILARANNHLEPFMQSLNYHGVPFLFAGASSLFSQPEVKMLLSFLQCLVYPDNNLAFHHLATSELYAVDPQFLASYYSQSRRQNRTFFEIFQNAGQEEIKSIIEDLAKYQKEISQKRAGEILYQYLKEKRYFQTLSDKADLASEQKMINLAKFFERISQFDHTSPDKSVLAFLENLELILAIGDEAQSSDIDPDIKAVNMMSVHASKGLEWPVVFVVNMVSDRFPGRDRREKIAIPTELIREKLPSGDFHLQEERRLFYVAVTRAKEKLFITSANDYGGKRAKKISPFVLELLDDPDLNKIKIKLSPLEKISRHQGNDIISTPSILPKYEDGEILHLSRQQIDDYFTCPKKYYFATILKIPLPTDWHFMYGTAIHEAVGRYYSRKIRGESPSFESLLEDFNQSFTSEGFITRQHEEERKRLGIETLARFYTDDQNLNLVPDKVEQTFEFFENGVKINGRYDLVVLNHHESEIFDYKTSNVKNQKEADTRIKESTQMQIYALAWWKKFQVIPKTTLVFIESGLSGRFSFSVEQLEKTRDMIHEVANGVRSNNFTPKPSQKHCSYCPYSDLCRESMAGK